MATTTPPYSGPNKTVLMSTLEIRHGNILYATGTTNTNFGANTEILNLSLETSTHTINVTIMCHNDELSWLFTNKLSATR